MSVSSLLLLDPSALPPSASPLSFSSVLLLDPSTPPYHIIIDRHLLSEGSLPIGALPRHFGLTVLRDCFFRQKVSEKQSLRTVGDVPDCPKRLLFRQKFRKSSPLGQSGSFGNPRILLSRNFVVIAQAPNFQSRLRFFNLDLDMGKINRSRDANEGGEILSKIL